MSTNTLFQRFSSAVLPQHIRAPLQRLAADWAEKKLDGSVSPREFVAFIGKAIDEAMELVKPLTNGATKKQIVLEFASYLYDTFAPLIVVRYGWVAWIIAMVFGGSAKDEVLQLVGWAIEVLYSANYKPA